MENQELCPAGHPIKTIPAGISKTTGRPYNAFKVCEDRQHNWKPIAPPSTYTPRPSKTEQITAMQNNKAKLIEEAQGRKDSSIAYFNAINNAIEVVQGIMASRFMDANPEEIQNHIRYWRDWFMKEWLNKPPF